MARVTTTTRTKTHLSDVAIKDWPSYFPTSINIRTWKNEANEALQASCGAEWGRAKKFLEEIDSKTIEQLAKIDQRWKVIDNKLILILNPLIKAAAREGPDVENKRLEATDNGNRLTSRQIIKMMYSECSVDQSTNNFYQISHLRALQWYGDSVKDKQNYLAKVDEIDRGIEPDKRPQEWELRDLMWKQFKKSGTLRWNVKQWENAEGDDVDKIRSRVWMRAKIRNFISQTKQENNDSQMIHHAENLRKSPRSIPAASAPRSLSRGSDGTRGSRTSGNTRSPRAASGSRSSGRSSAKGSGKGRGESKDRGRSGREGRDKGKSRSPSNGKNHGSKGRKESPKDQKGVCYESKNTGKCSKGSACRYSQDKDTRDKGKRAPSPATRAQRLNKDGVCKWFAENRCKHGDKCSNPHSIDAAPATPSRRSSQSPKDKKKGKKTKSRSPSPSRSRGRSSSSGKDLDVDDKKKKTRKTKSKKKTQKSTKSFYLDCASAIPIVDCAAAPCVDSDFSPHGENEDDYPELRPFDIRSPFI